MLNKVEQSLTLIKLLISTSTSHLTLRIAMCLVL